MRRPWPVVEELRQHADVAVVVEREVDVLARDEVDREPAAGRAAHRDQRAARLARSAASSQKADGNTGRGALLGPAEEAPGPLPRLDPLRGDVGELGRRAGHAARS